MTRSCDPSRPSVAVWGGQSRWWDLSGRQSPTSIRRGGDLSTIDGVCQPFEEGVEPEKGHQFFKGAIGTADSGLCMKRRKEIRM